MNYYKESIIITLEIVFTICIIILSYRIWNNFNINEYNIAQIKDKTRTEQLYTNNKELILHNISKKKNDTKLLLKLDKEQLNRVEEAYLNINNITYNLKKMEFNEKEEHCYYEIRNINFNEYETIKYHYFIETNNDILNYEFTIETI